MPDFIYLLGNRLSADQQGALRHLREAARQAEMLLFLIGDAVRDLTSGHAVRDIEVAVSGNALELKKILKDTPAQVWGEDHASRSLYLCFPGTVRVDVVSTQRVEYPKPGQPVFHPASIHEDLRRRDFTVNAMAISLNEGSYGLLMDPLNGAADIEARALRLVSNYGFLEEPALMVRAVRYRARLGWELDPKTQVRYENAKTEGVMEFLSNHERSRELEQIGHEDDGLKVLRALEDEGWMKVLYPSWTASKADEERLQALHGLAVDLLMQGVRADVSAAQMQLLTAKMTPKELAGLKKQLLRPGFVEEWNTLDSLASGFQKTLLSKDNQVPSASYRLFTTYDPEAVLWLGFTSKDAAVKDRYNLFLKVWPEARLRIPHALMQEMRIRPELANYNEIVHAVFLELIDGKLNTPEEMRAFLEPYSPPTPPPQVTIKRTRGRRGEAKVKDFDEEEEGEEGAEEGEEELEEIGGDEDEIGLGGMNLPKVDLEPDLGDDDGEDDEEEAVEGAAEEEEAGEDEEEEEEPATARRGSKAAKAQPRVEPARKEKAGNGKPHAAKPVAAPKTKEPPAKPAAKAHGAPAKTTPKAKPEPPARKTAPEPHPHKVAPPAAKHVAKKTPPKPAAKPAPSKPHSAHAGNSKHGAPAKSHKPAKPAPKKAAGKKR